jgi:hypothetical protein
MPSSEIEPTGQVTEADKATAEKVTPPPSLMDLVLFAPWLELDTWNLALSAASKKVAK